MSLTEPPTQQSESPEGVEKAAPKTTVLDLFRPRKMALRTVNMCFQVDMATIGLECVWPHKHLKSAH